MASDKALPVVQPLPKFIVLLGLAISLVLGQVLLLNDRRVAKKDAKAASAAQKPLGMPVFK